MKRQHFPRIALGDGKYCYSGPNCCQHGSPSTAQELSSYQKTATDMITRVQAVEDGALKIFKDKMHETSVDVQKLEDLGEMALQTNRAAHYCEEHKIYHIYDANMVTNSTAELIKPVIKSLHQAKLAGLITGSETHEIRQTLKAIEASFSYKKQYKQDRELLNKLQDELQKNPDFTETEEGKKALLLREEAKETARFFQNRHNIPKVKDKTPAIVDQKDVDDATMLEYWRCGRKTKYETPAIGTAQIAAQKETETMSTYKCDSCPKYHIGHGFGKGPEDEAIKLARVHWMENSAKSNMFAFAKGLIN